MSRLRQAADSLAAVFANPQLRRAELAWGGSIAAEWAHFVALGVFAYNEGGAVAVGIAGVVRMLPAAVLAPFASVLGDRWRRERFVLVTAAVGTLALAGSALVFYVTDGAAGVYALAAAVGVTTTLFRPAHQALLPSLARTPGELVAANGATSTLESVGTLVGPVGAGVLVAAIDPGAVFVAGAVALGLSTFLLVGLRVEGSPAPRTSGGMAALTSGFAVLLGEPGPRVVGGLMAAQAFVRGCLNVLIVVVAFEVLDAGEGMVGYLTAALGVGGLVGALGAAALESRRLAVPLGVSLVFWGIPIALVAPVPFAFTALLLLAVVGIANSVEDVAGFTLLQRIVPGDALARALGAFWGIAMAGVAAGSIVAPLIVEALGPRTALVVVGVILPALTALSWRRLDAIDRATEPAGELDLVQETELFAPLSIVAKEQLAAAFTPVDAPAGTVVIRAGDEGDRFYVLDDGEVEVDAAGRRSRLTRRGESFGEIALLRSVPRTATVTAVRDSRLYALERLDFLAAVTGHSAVGVAAHAVAERRLAGDAAPAD